MCRITPELRELAGAALPSAQKGVVEVTGNAVGAVRLAARRRRARQ
jgi:hypothetical protein